MAYVIDRNNIQIKAEVLKNWLPSRAMKVAPTTLVLHSTAGHSALSSISWLKKIKYSYHYIIEDNGLVYKCVPTSRIAYHAGISEGPNGSNVNNYSFGISFANMDNGEPYYPQQVQACYGTCVQLIRAFPSIKWITTHYQISPGRKKDPNTFDFKGFAKVIQETTGVMPWKDYNLGVVRGHIL